MTKTPARTGGERSIKTITEAAHSLAVVFKFARRRDELALSPMPIVRDMIAEDRRRKGNRPSTRVRHIEDMPGLSRFAAACAEHEHRWAGIAALFLFYTGARVGEVRGGTI